MVDCVCHAEADSRNPLTGVVAQHTTVSGLEKGAGSASVCGMSALCLNRMEKNGGSFHKEIHGICIEQCNSVS